jgi:hypothetical protein
MRDYQGQLLRSDYAKESQNSHLILDLISC